jgi:hypothetical protein
MKHEENWANRAKVWQQSVPIGVQPSGDHQPIELLGHGAELDVEVGGQVLDINFAWLCDAVKDRWLR